MRSEDDPLASAFATAITSGDLTALAALLHETPTLATDRFGSANTNRSAMHILTDWPGHTPHASEVARLLVSHGADVNATFVGNHTETPLHWAASSDDADLVHTLIDLGAAVEAGGGVLTDGPPLDDAIIFQQWNAATALVERGAAVELWHAAALGLDNTVSERLAHTTPTTQQLDNALWHAAAGGRTSTTRLLQSAGANPAWVGWDHLSAPQAAERNGHHDTARALTNT